MVCLSSKFATNYERHVSWNEISLVIQFNRQCYCKVYNSCLMKCLPSVYTVEDAYATRQLHRQWRSGPCRAKRPANTSSVRQCCTAATDVLVARCDPGLRSVLLGSHRSGWMKVGVESSRNRSVACPVCRWKIKKSLNTSHVTDRTTAAATTAHGNNSRRWSSPHDQRREVRELLRCRRTP